MTIYTSIQNILLDESDDESVMEAVKKMTKENLYNDIFIDVSEALTEACRAINSETIPEQALKLLMDVHKKIKYQGK